MSSKKTKRQARMLKKGEHSDRLQRMKMQSRFEYHYENNPAQEFVAAVKKAIKSIDFEDTATFSQAQIEFFRRHREYGWNEACEWYGLHDDVGPEGFSKPAVAKFGLACLIGHIVYQHLSIDFRKKYVPFNDVLIVPVENSFRVTFCSLSVFRDSDGQVWYYSPRKPLLTIDGIARPVAFARHVIEQTMLRIAGDSFDYLYSGDVFAFFYKCMYFEECRLYPDQRAFTFYDECRDGFFAKRYVDKMIGSPDPAKKYYLKIGYCPVLEDECKFWQAKTLILPGYRSTPEYGLILKEKDPHKRSELKARMENLKRDDLWRSGDINDIKWFHDRGVHQVKAFDKDLDSA
jgi:hypothetical protein